MTKLGVRIGEESLIWAEGAGQKSREIEGIAEECEGTEEAARFEVLGYGGGVG